MAKPCTMLLRAASNCKFWACSCSSCCLSSACWCASWAFWASSSLSRCCRISLWRRSSFSTSRSACALTSAAPTAASITSIVTPATANAIPIVLMTEGWTMMVGSGTTVAAAIAVKCREQMASVSNPGAAHRALRGSRRRLATMAAAASAMPRITEATTCGVFHSITPGTITRRHAGVVHHADARAHHGAANSHPCVRTVGREQMAQCTGVEARLSARCVSALDRHQIADRGDADGDDQRRQGQRRVIGGREARIVGQHGHEVGGPDAGAGADARSDPARPGGDI